MHPTVKAEDNFPTAPPISRAAMVTPLARAALDNGVDFADVEAYCSARRAGADAEALAKWLGK